MYCSIRGSSIQPFSWTATTTLDGCVSFSFHLPLKTMKGGSISPLAVNSQCYCEVALLTASSTYKNALLAFYVDYSSWSDVKICRSLIHVSYQVELKIVVRANAVQHSMKVQNSQFEVSRKGLCNRCPHSEREIVAPQKLGRPATRSVELAVRKLFLYSL